MRRTVVALAALAAASATCSGYVHAQARGPSHAQTREDGMHISTRMEQMELAMEQAAERAEEERITLRDPAERARRFAELEAILRRVPGRFRIEGRIERPTGPWVKTGGDIKGIADCSAVGGSIGLNCIINASWPVVDGAEAIRIPGNGPVQAIPSKPPSEQLDAMRPAVLFIGLNIDPPGLRAMMVTADTMAFNWVGYLQDGGVNLTRPERCWTDVRCYRTFRLSAEPEGTTVSFELSAGIYTLSFVLHGDPEATLSKPMKTLN